MLGIDLPAKGRLIGRVWSEALEGSDKAPRIEAHTVASAPAANGFTTTLDWQETGGRPYYDAAGMTGRTIGLGDRKP